MCVSRGLWAIGFAATQESLRLSAGRQVEIALMLSKAGNFIF